MPPDTLPDSTEDSTESTEIEPVGIAEAEKIMEEALQPYLADEWRVIDRGPYATRLTRGMRNLDVRVDLLGQVEIEESGLTPLQDSGRLMAWMVLLAALLVVLALSAALGIL
jgi:hypothetical protein